MTRRRIPVAPFPASSTAADLGATPQTRNAAPSRTARQVETIAERRVIALRLRKAGGSYREIAGQLAVDVATAYADVRTGQVLDAIDQTGIADNAIVGRNSDNPAGRRQSRRTRAGFGRHSYDEVANMSLPPLPASQAVSVYPIVALRHD